jgi:membrane protease YdiL (CAAX protease family)
MTATRSPLSPAVAHPRWLAAAILLALAWSTVSGDVVGWLAQDLPRVPYLRSLLATLTDLAVLLLLAAWAARRTPWSLLGLAGLRKPVAAPLAWAAIVLVPAWVACALWIATPPPVRGVDLLWQGLAGPVAEELIYRGLAIGLLTTLCGWRWLPACLVPALLFGLAHLGQGADPASIAGIALITAAGGLLFGWLWVRWDGNLWPPVLLHAGMNSLWLVYGLGENAIGGLPGNVLRAGIVVAAIGLTLVGTRRATLTPPASPS